MANVNNHPVAQGMWSTPKAQYSQNTQNLLKEMMKESKLTNFQQRQLTKTMTDGSTLPQKCHPTTSAKPRGPPPKKVQSKIVNPRTHSSQIRSKDQIEETPGVYDRERFRPMPLNKYGGHYEKEKKKLSNLMAYGEDIEPAGFVKPIRRPQAEEDQELVNPDRFAELQAEIEERRAFQDEMESLGQGDKYRTIIATEVSQKIREMEVIDKKRSGDLERAIEADDKRKQAERDRKK